MRIFLYIFIIIFSFPGEAKEFLRLADFGQNGQMTPKLFGDPPSAGFFQNTFEMAMERQFDYHLEIDLLKKPGVFSMQQIFYLTLINDSEMTNNLCLSLQSSDHSNYENFLIAINPFDTISINTSGYSWASLLRIVSTQDFSVNVSDNDTELFSGEYHKALPPSNFGDSYTEMIGNYFQYCVDINRMQLVVEHSSGERVMAWFRRFLITPRDALCYDTNTWVDTYGIEVYWPDETTRHHRSNGSAPACPDPDDTPIPRGAKCVKVSYSTTSLQDQTTLWWEHQDGSNIDGRYFDDVLFGTECGRARCNAKNLLGKCCNRYEDPLTQRICIEPVDWLWYVYKPELQSVCSPN